MVLDINQIIRHKCEKLHFGGKFRVICNSVALQYRIYCLFRPGPYIYYCRLTSISTWKSNLLRTKLCVAPLKFSNGSLISSYTLTCVLLLNHAEIKVNLSY